MVEEGDIIVLLDAGEYLSPEETQFDREVFQITVGLPDQRTKLWGMNKTTQRTLAAAYGDPTEGWVNKGVRIEITKQKVRGQTKDVLYGHPAEIPDAQKPETRTDLEQYDTLFHDIMEANPSLTSDALEKLVAAEKEKVPQLTNLVALHLVASDLGTEK